MEDRRDGERRGWGGGGDKLRVEGCISGISGRLQLNVRIARAILPSFRVGREGRGVMGGGGGEGAREVERASASAPNRDPTSNPPDTSRIYYRICRD